MPELDRFYREDSERAGLLAVVPKKSANGVAAQMASRGHSFPVMVDPGSVRTGYRIRYVPTLVIIDQDGEIVRRAVGGIDAGELSRIVDDLTG